MQPHALACDSAPPPTVCGFLPRCLEGRTGITDTWETPPLDGFLYGGLTVRIGCELTYETPFTTPALMILRPRRSSKLRIQQEMVSFEPGLDCAEETDSHGNIIDRVMLKPGTNVIRHDALVTVSALTEHLVVNETAALVNDLPLALLRYTQPSRYCDADMLTSFAAEKFSHYPPGAPTVRAISDWVHNNIEYRFGSGSPDLTASQIIHRGYGVCRDFAHVSAVLCRTFNIPTRYVTGHLPDIGFQDSGTPMDFHAYTEVYLNGDWHVIDSRFNVPRTGRIDIARGFDAVDGAFSTIYGPAKLTSYYAWCYQVRAGEVALGSPIDLSLRLDGTPEMRF